MSTDTAKAAEPAESDRFIDRDELLRMVPLSYPQLWGMMQRHEFPRSRVVSGNRVAWLLSEVRAWMAARPVRQLRDDPDDFGVPMASGTGGVTARRRLTKKETTD